MKSFRGGGGRACLAALGALLLSACVSKNDLQDMETTMLAEMHALRARQDSLADRMEQLRAALVDTLSRTTQQTATGRSELDRRFSAIQDQLGQVAALVGQNQRMLAQMRAGSGAAGGAVDTAAGAAATGGAGAGGEPAGGGGEPPSSGAASGGSSGSQQLYQAALQQYRRGAYGTARSGLQEFLKNYPNDDLAPDAQYYIAQSWEQQDSTEEALDAYARVLQLFPNSRRAPAALYKSGLLELRRGNFQDARTYFSRVVRGYPDSDEASLAREQLGKLKG